MENMQMPVDLEMLDKLEALAQAATPGDWIACRFGGLMGGPERHYVNGSAQAQIASFSVTFHGQAPDDEPERQQANTEFAAGFSPKTALALIELARRSLTSGAPADTGAVAIFPPELPKFMPGFFSTMKECWDHAVLSGWRAASVHDADAPSAEQAYVSVGADDKLKGLMEGWRAANTLQAASAAWRAIIVHIDARSQQATAAGAGSAQPRAEGDERAPCSHVWNDFGQLGGRNVSWCPRCDTLAWTGKEPEPSAALDQGAQAATTASTSDASLRETVRAITLLIQNREWADVLDMDADAAALWDAVDDMISDRAALARAPLPAEVGALYKAALLAVERMRGCAATYIEDHSKDSYPGEAGLRPQDVANMWAQEIHAIDAKTYLDEAIADLGAQPVDDARDAARLDFLDTNVHRFRMGWEVGAAPVGNLSVRSIIMGGKSIREAIDAAMRANDGAAEGGAA